MDQTLFRSEIQQPVTVWLNHYTCVLFEQLLLCRSSFYLSFCGFSSCISIKGLLFELPEKAVSSYFLSGMIYRQCYQKPPTANTLLPPAFSCLTEVQKGQFPLGVWKQKRLPCTAQRCTSLSSFEKC